MFRRRRDNGPEPEEGRGVQREVLPQRYKMRERIFDIGEDFWIEDEHGHRAFKVDGKALRLRNTLNIEGPHGEVLCQIQGRVARVRDSMAIERNGQKIAEVHKDLVNVVHDHLEVDMVGSGPDLDVSGNLLDHEYTIKQGVRPIAEVSKKWFRIQDTYSIEVMPGQDDALMIAISVCVDQLVAGDANRT